MPPKTTPPKSQPGATSTRVEYFPRAFEFYDQHSPLFWAENKDRFIRQLLIRDIEAMTGRRLCVYFASPYFTTPLHVEDIPRLNEIVHADGSTPFDLLLETPGGDTDAAEGMISLLRKINPDFRVIVPLQAKSNGTLICLAARKILMAHTSQLGPVEPQMNGVPVSILMENPDLQREDFILWRMASDGLKRTTALATELLDQGMMKNQSAAQKKKVVQVLSTRERYHSHGSVINCDDARKLGLAVEEPAEELWKRIWLLHALYAYDSSQKGIGKFFEGRTRSRASVGDDPAKA